MQRLHDFCFAQEIDMQRQRQARPQILAAGRSEALFQQRVWGVWGSSKGRCMICGDVSLRGDGFMGVMGLVRLVFTNKGFLDRMGMGDRGGTGVIQGVVYSLRERVI